MPIPRSSTSARLLLLAVTIAVAVVVVQRGKQGDESRPVACAADRIDAKGVVEHVYDGDTVRLADGKKIRLLGINAPEVGREGAPSDPMADAAHRALERLLPPGTPVQLRSDRERQDRYGRALAHLFLADGTNVQAALLEQGVAFAWVVPPNEWGSICYAARERSARAQGKGLWTLPDYQPLDAPAVPVAGDSAFHLVRGTVQRVGESRSAVWLNLSSGVAIRIPRADLEHFADVSPRELRGRRLVARGWLYERSGELRMTVRHPSALEMEQ